MRFLKGLAIVATPFLFAFATSAKAQHADIRPRTESGKIVTDAFEDATSTQTANVRVFAYDFGEDLLDPFFIGDPGVNSPISTLPSASQLILNIPAAASAGLPRSLSYWSGTGPVSFTSVPSGESLRFNFGAQNLTATGTGTSAVGPMTLSVSGAGGIHSHLNSFLNGSDGNSTPATGVGGDGIEAAAGIYVVPMTIGSSAGGIATSDTIYLVFNNGLTEAVHDDAIGYIKANIVPEPATAGLLIPAALGLLARRRRR